MVPQVSEEEFRKCSVRPDLQSDSQTSERLLVLFCFNELQTFRFSIWTGFQITTTT